MTSEQAEIMIQHLSNIDTLLQFIVVCIGIGFTWAFYNAAKSFFNMFYK